MSELIQFDVFLSHNSEDKPFVEALAKRLEDEGGVDVWLDTWHLIPGEPWQEALEVALDRCQTYAVFVGSSGLGSWHHEEMRSALSIRVRDKQRRVIPVLLPGSDPDKLSELSRFLPELTWVDFRDGLEDTSAFYRLVAGIKGVSPGRDGDLAVDDERPGKTKRSIYLSSTFRDLETHRQQVSNILSQKGYSVIAMNVPDRPLDPSLALVGSSEIYIGIIAWRYGYVPPGQPHSVTELEYRRAKEAGVPCFIFLLDENAPWPRTDMEKGEAETKIEALREELVKTEDVQFFSEPGELARQVNKAVTEWAQAQLDAAMDALRAAQARTDRQRREVHSRQRVVNLRPLDAAYSFKGRSREIKTLQRHLTTRGVRMISVTGRSGMGKTALVSRVLAEIEEGEMLIPGKEHQLAVEGIIYLSALSTGLSLDRIYADVGRMLGEPATGELERNWSNPRMPLPAKIEGLLGFLQNGLYLILLDNLEDELGPDGTIEQEGLYLFVESCLKRPSGMKLIVTSRERVKIPGDLLPRVRTITLRKGLSDEDAVSLLRKLDPDGTLGLAGAPKGDQQLYLAAKRTYGIPRALELVAGFLSRDPTTSLSELLDDEDIFDREVMSRLVAKSYERMQDSERRVIDALSVFEVPVDDTAISFFVSKWMPGLEVRAILRRLIDSHYVNVDRGRGQYSLHPLDREYAYHDIPRAAKLSA